MAEPQTTSGHGPSLMAGLLLGVAALGGLICGGAVPTPKPSTPAAAAEITGPDSIEFSGELALFRASVPGTDPKSLIYTWGIESLDAAVTHKPALVRTPNADEIQITTPAGRWRIWCAIANPAAKSGQMLQRELTVPGNAKPDSPKPVPPGPQPEPKPEPTPTPPAPPPTPPAPENRFSDLIPLVREWVSQVNSPAKGTETAAMRAGALAIAARLDSGELRGGIEPLKLVVLLAVRQVTSSATKSNPAAWTQFANQSATYLGTAAASGKLNTSSAADWSALLKALAAGLS